MTNRRFALTKPKLEMIKIEIPGIKLKFIDVTLKGLVCLLSTEITIIFLSFNLPKIITSLKKDEAPAKIENNDNIHHLSLNTIVLSDDLLI